MSHWRLRVTPELVNAFILSLRERMSASSVHQAIFDLSYALAAMLPGRDWSWIRRHPARPKTAEIRASKKPIEPPDAGTLITAAIDCCDAAAAEPPTLQSAIRYRDGVIISFAVSTAIRRRNLAELEIGRHILVGENTVRLLLEDSVKNHEVIDVPLSETVATYLRRYLTRYRPLLLAGGDDCRAVWIGREGGPMDYAGFYNVFDRMGRRLIGRPISVHSTRHALATGLMEANPAGIELAAAALAHRGTSSVNRTYDRSDSGSANRTWRQLLRQHARER